MATLTDSTNFTGTITLAKATGTSVVLDTAKTYLTKDIELTINAPTTTATASGLTVSYGSGWISAGSTTCSDANLIASNIKSGVTIFGVEGTNVSNTVLVSDTIDANGGTIRTITTTEDPIYLEVLNATSNGTYTPDTNHYYSEVEVSVTANPTLQAKTNISPTTSSQTITADNGYDGLSSVQINAMPSMTLPTSATLSATSGYSSKATISRSTSDQYINIPTGYNSAGAYYKVSAVANGSATGPSTVSGTSATVSTGTNTLTLTKTGVSTTPTVSAGYVSSATSSTATVTLSASATIKAATTYHPSSTDQTISSGTYTTGTQTIKAVTVSGLSADKILSGTTVKIGDSTDDDCVTSVSGSVVIQHYYTGSSTPSDSTGANGDIYLKTS